LEMAQSKNEYRLHGHSWVLPEADNFLAELAAIDYAIRSIPITVPLDIYTDSAASKGAIRDFNSQPRNYVPLNSAGRPYLISVHAAMEAREKKGAYTHIHHVYSHTGTREDESIGNESADRFANIGALDENASHSIFNPRKYELPYMVCQRRTWADGAGVHCAFDPIHGNIRQKLKDTFKTNLTAMWSARPKRGELMNINPTGLQKLIKDVWKSPSTQNLDFIISTLNQTSKREINEEGDYRTTKCDRCGTGQAQTSAHRLLECPANADLWNKADELIWETLDTLGRGAHTKDVHQE
jgi:hypothetical protein